jgi:ribosomal protein L40E
MKKIKSIFLVLSVLLALAPGYIVIPAAIFSQGHYIDSGISHDQYGPNTEEEFQQKEQLPIKKWLMLFGTLSGFALLLLIIFEIGGGGLLPDEIENIIAKICAGIISIALLLYLYYISSKIIFIILIPITVVIILYIYMQRVIKRIYKRNFGKPSSPDNWICRKCGTENSKLLTECDNCNSANKISIIKPSEDTWICANCDYANPISDKSCARCGMRKEGE